MHELDGEVSLPVEVEIPEDDVRSLLDELLALRVLLFLPFPVPPLIELLAIDKSSSFHCYLPALKGSAMYQNQNRPRIPRTGAFRSTGC